MEIDELMNEYKRKGIHLEIKKGELAYRAAKGIITNEIIRTLKERKNDILKHLGQKKDTLTNFKLTKATKDRVLLYDRVIWTDYSNRIMEVGVANGPHIVIRQKGIVDTEILQKAVDIILQRHDALSASVEKSYGNLFLARRPVKKPVVMEFVAEGDTSEELEKDAFRIANDFIYKEYNLDTGPLYRVFVIRLSENDFILGAGLHHVIGDGLSILTFFQEISALYSSIAAQLPPPLRTLSFQYFDYLYSVNEFLEGLEGKSYLKYWVDLLSMFPETHFVAIEQLPYIRPERGPAEREALLIDSEVAENLKLLATTLKTTFFRLIIAAHKVTIWRMSGQEEVTVVVPRSKRDNPELQKMIGNFTTEFAYKTSLKGDPTFLEVLNRVNRAMIDAEQKQPVPLDLVRYELSKRDIHFVAPVMDLLPGDSIKPKADSGPERLRLHPSSTPDGFPGTYGLVILERPDGVECSLMYRKDLYKASNAREFLNLFRDTIEFIIANTESKLSDL